LKNYHYIASTPSTNILLKELVRKEKLPEFFAVRTAFQSAGKGQLGNSWEAERGKNMLCSVLLYPHSVAIHEQFMISQMVSVAILRVLQKYGVDCCIKWPNDIYVGNKKLGGILIENSLRGSKIDFSIIGIGLNINQKEFKSNAPNPVSTFNILQKKLSVKEIFSEIMTEIKNLYLYTDIAVVKSEYLQYLFRKTGFYSFKIPNGEVFEAAIDTIGSDGQLWLKKRDGNLSGFYFKEVEFIF